jgi:hypothetical protein
MSNEIWVLAIGGRINSGTGRMPPALTPPAPRTTAVLADDAGRLVLGIEMQCLALARDDHLQPDSKTACTE